ncbi:DNA-binding transcriptional activator of the SARP family [Micromonospora auratinigra]|uniref:DNA-binding transcriptional activator of the SARP family n=1 Tax=Micromonospora auratinigra TaxID=261654 RepID=A0A1A8ZFT0_9ACTN|nr:DNA-binding transcriptional activator of the SARP family [Micromonospora auratinigra]
MEFNILGALEVKHEGNICTPTAPKVQWVLALLLCRANQIVSIGSLTEELWGTEPPRSAVTTTQTYIYQLRKKFEREGIAARPEERLETRPPGYLLRVGDAELDADRFERQVERGRELLAQGRADVAADLLRDALAMWRGPALANVPVGRLLEGHVAHLEESRVRALELRIEADIALGRHRELIPELRLLVAAYPLNEWMHGELIQALHRAGRRGEALQAYQNLRDILNEELGLDPSPELQRMQREVLAPTGGVPAPRRPMSPVTQNAALAALRAQAARRMPVPAR